MLSSKKLPHEAAQAVASMRFLWYCLTGKKFLGKSLKGIIPVPSGIYPGVIIDRLNLKRGKISHSQQGEDLVLDRILSRVLYKSLYENGFFVEVGAFDAIKDSVTYSLYKRGWSGISIDPSKACASSFAKHRKNNAFYRCLVGSEDRDSISFFINKNAINDSHTGNTLYPIDQSKYREVSLPMRSLDSILRERNNPRIDVLSIDVEGAEMDVLGGLDIQKHSPSVIAIEIVQSSITDMIKNENPIHTLLTKSGYKLVASCVITQFYVRADLIA